MLRREVQDVAVQALAPQRHDVCTGDNMRYGALSNTEQQSGTLLGSFAIKQLLGGGVSSSSSILKLTMALGGEDLGVKAAQVELLLALPDVRLVPLGAFVLCDAAESTPSWTREGSISRSNPRLNCRRGVGRGGTRREVLSPGCSKQVNAVYFEGVRGSAGFFRSHQQPLEPPWWWQSEPSAMQQTAPGGYHTWGGRSFAR